MWWKMLVWLAWAGWARAAGADVGGTSWLTDFGHNLRSELAEVLELPAVNYSKPVINATYVSRVEFDTRAMGHLYNSSKLAIDFIANKEAYPEGIVSVSDGHVELGSWGEHWRPLLGHYAGPASLAIALLLFAVSMPIAGVLWCCCEWCGSRRRRPFDRKYDACVKGILAILLIALLTLFLFGVVCAFSTEEQLEDGLDSAPSTVRAGIRDGRTFLNATQAHARHLLVNNYDELKETLVWILNSSGRTISTALGEFSRARSVTTLHKMVQQLDAVHADLQTVHALTRELRANADRLNSGLRRVKGQLLQTLATCDQPQCLRLQDKYKIGQLDTEIQYSQMLDKYFPTMPDVSELLNNVSLLLNSSIKQEVAEGQRVFSNIQKGIERSVNEHIPSLRDAVTDTGVRLARVADEITWAAGNASLELAQHGDVADGIAQLHQRYGPYRRYVGLAAASALLLIVTLMVWGLTCGVCGKRPDVYGASDCCNKGAGSKCLLCGMCMTFLLGGAVAAVIAVYFLLGVAATRGLCDPLTEPRDNRLFGDLEKFVDLERVMFDEHLEPDFNMTAVLVACHANRTVYKTFHLHRVYNLTAERARIDAEVSQRVAALRPLYPANARQITILRPSAKAKLQQLADIGLSDFNFDKILDALETNITSLSLEALVSQLRGAALQLQARPGFLDVSNSLRDAASMLEVYHKEIVLAMLNHTHTLNSTALRLRDGLRFNHSSLKEAIAYLMHETSQAEAFLNTQGPQLVQNMTREFGEAMALPLQQYLQYVADAADNDVGRCAPLSSAFNATRDAACQKLLLPVNGYWLSVSWCLLVAIPMLVVAQRLARLYLHVDPYPGPLVEAEYLYDAYADRDNVPLANGSKRSTLDIEGKIAEWRGRAAPSAPPAAGETSPTQLLLAGSEVVCTLVAPPAALIDDLKTRLDAKDEDNESGIHESDAYKAEKRVGRSGTRGAGGGGGGAVPGGAGESSATVAPPVDAQHARRYNDMAPKHWEEGPPRYHGPTEYERPPPYYYPGPHDRQ